LEGRIQRTLIVAIDFPSFEAKRLKLFGDTSKSQDFFYAPHRL
jgi:hypothetical protein